MPNSLVHVRLPMPVHLAAGALSRVVAVPVVGLREHKVHESGEVCGDRESVVLAPAGAGVAHSLLVGGDQPENLTLLYFGLSDMAIKRYIIQLNGRFLGSTAFLISRNL